MRRARAKREEFVLGFPRKKMALHINEDMQHRLHDDTTLWSQSSPNRRTKRTIPQQNQHPRVFWVNLRYVSVLF